MKKFKNVHANREYKSILKKNNNSKYRKRGSTEPSSLTLEQQSETKNYKKNNG